MYLQDLEPALGVRYRNLYLPVEAPRPAEGRIHGIRAVGRGYDNDLPACLQPVHKSQELRHHAALHLAGHILAFGGYRVDLVYEYDGRGVLLGLLEDLSQLALRFAIVFAHHFWPVDRDEVCAGFAGYGLCQEGLSAAGRTVEQDTLRRVNSEALEELGVLHRKLYHLSDLLLCVPQAANIFVGYPSGPAGCLSFGLLFRLFLHIYVGSIDHQGWRGWTDGVCPEEQDAGELRDGDYVARAECIVHYLLADVRCHGGAYRHRFDRRENDL